MEWSYDIILCCAVLYQNHTIVIILPGDNDETYNYNCGRL